RHQWNPHKTCLPSFCERYSAQRLAASMESSPSAHRSAKTAATVLNALRHQWNPHWSRWLGCALAAMCSTPCGINGILTFERTVRDHLASGAQRLSASIESSPIAPETPQAVLQVLNALRHQWNPHILPGTVPEMPLKVLNALRHKWNPHCKVRGVG